MEIDPHHNYTACGGPHKCRYCAAILSETPHEAASRLAAENRERGLRTASDGSARRRSCPIGSSIGD